MMRVELLLLTAVSAFAQTGQTGMLSGKIVDEFGIAVSGASVQAKAAGKEFKATSSATGEYTIDKLPPGAYEVTVTSATMKNFVKKDVNVTAAGASHVDVTLLQVGLGTLGDGDRFAYRRIGYKPPSGPVPRLSDGTPDLSGYWFQSQTDQSKPDDSKPEVRPEQPDPFPWADAIRRERQASNMRDLPDSRCLPAFGFGPKFVHTPSILVMLGSTGGDSPRQIFLDGRGHPTDLNPTWQGHSVGHWEGNTLVVDTVGFNGLGWIYGGYPMTEALHVIERFHRIDLGHMETEMTMEDPPVLRKPWTQKRVLNLDPKEDVEENVCIENEKDYAHMVGK
jgi:hypothetical protein